MAIAACFFTASLTNSTNPKLINLHRSFHLSSSRHLHPRLSLPSPSPSPCPAYLGHHRYNDHRLPLFIPSSSGGDGGIHNHPPPNGGGGGDSSDNNNHDGDGGSAEDKNREEAMMVLVEAKRSDTRAVVSRFFELENSRFLRWLMQFDGFRERLLADDLFLAKVGMECGVGMFTKTAAEYERRRENFFNELEVVFADVLVFIFSLGDGHNCRFHACFLPAPTVSLRSPLAGNAGPIAKFFHNCPDNAFQSFARQILITGGSRWNFLFTLTEIRCYSSKFFIFCSLLIKNLNSHAKSMSVLMWICYCSVMEQSFLLLAPPPHW
ncbi:protein RETICULATA-RELATED [Salix suchowensis]|nr:protein RETICULATA-RELATED [Salix suchowensis]